jgi:hypothetical protein
VTKSSAGEGKAVDMANYTLLISKDGRERPIFPVLSNKLTTVDCI